MECEFYLRSWRPTADGRWPILQQDEDGLIFGSEPWVVPLSWEVTGQHRVQQAIEWGQIPEQQNLSW